MRRAWACETAAGFGPPLFFRRRRRAAAIARVNTDDRHAMPLDDALSRVATAVAAHRDACLTVLHSVRAQAPGVSWRLRALGLSDEAAAFWLCAVQSPWNEAPALLVMHGRAARIERELDRLVRLHPLIFDTAAPPERC